MAAATDLGPVWVTSGSCDVSLDQLGDQLRIAAVEGVCTEDSDGVDVRQHGERSILTRMSNAWVERILQAAEDDAYVAEAFGSVTDLLAPPSLLLQPRLIWRVVKNRRRKQADKSKGARRLNRYPSTATVAKRGSPSPHPHLGRDEHDSHKVG
jgi:hypothetical protein